MKDYKDLLSKRKYDPSNKPEQEEIIIRIEGQNIGSLQNFITLTGMPKNGKGRYVAAIAAGAITRQPVFSISTRLPENRNRIFYLDTEQGSWDFHKSMENICKLAGVNALPANFDAFNVREDSPGDIWQMIECYLKENADCSLLILDGLLDLLNSYNDEGESKRLINLLKRWTKIYNCLAPCVLHRGKSTSTTVGHLGGMADRASQSILIVEKIKERSSYQLRPDFLRSAVDFNPIEIFYNKYDQAWQQTDYIPADDAKVKPMQYKPSEMDITIHRDNVMRVFNSQELQDYHLLVQNISEIYARGKNWAKTCVPHLLKEQLIYKTNYGYTNVKQAKLYVEK